MIGTNTYVWKTRKPRKTEMVPRKRIAKNDAMLATIAKDLMDRAGYEWPKGWCVYAVTSKRGMCKPTKRYISIPQWAIDKGMRDYTYLDWYVAHELAHMVSVAIKGLNDNHGPVFMSILKELCPVEAQKHEYGYKPRNAASAGLSR